MREPVTSWLTPVTDKLEHLQPSIGLVESDYSNGRLLCLVQPRFALDEKCRNCLGKTSASKSVGEFLFSSRYSLFVVHVFRTLHSQKQIVTPCIESGACSHFHYDVYSDDLCDGIHNKRVDINQASSKMSEDEAVDVLKPKNQVRTHQQMHLQCVNATPVKEISASEDTLACMMDLVKYAKGSVHWLKVNAIAEEYAFLLLQFNKVRTKLISKPNCQYWRLLRTNVSILNFARFRSVMKTTTRIFIRHQSVINSLFICQHLAVWRISKMGVLHVS
uniref:AlNc14C60G4417 protein n=1 Tax=Albugo laibachii Nc14 TaxID=890382 RepID=F0WCN5_9STRA|nr:AlNc14C60G4417 [Albugo laibachii Nc14]|eukprot:CCA18956.1 AlNc14C60G4417 [Albugo laibachii Nc14]